MPYQQRTRYQSEGSITDCVGVACYCGNNVAGRGEFLTILTFIFGIGDRLKAISSTTATFTTDKHDFSIVTADAFPVFDFAGVDLSNGFNVKVTYRVFRINDDCDTIICENSSFKTA